VNLYNKFKKGLLTAASSFSLIWKNKKLLVYLGIPILAHIILEILIHNINFDLSCFFSQKNLVIRMFKMAGPYKLLNYIRIIFVYLAHLAIMNFGYIALTHHTSMLCKKKKVSVKDAIIAALNRIKTALIWTLFLLIPTVTFYAINTCNQKIESSFTQILYIIFISALLATWSLVTSFVIQSITINSLGVIASIRKSIQIIKNVFLEFLGTIFWLGLIGILSATPFMLLEKYANKFYLITIPLALLIYCTITSAYTVAKTLLYLDFKKR